MEGKKRSRRRQRSESLHDLDHHDGKPAKSASRRGAFSSLRSREDASLGISNQRMHFCQWLTRRKPTDHLAPYFGGIDWYMRDPTALSNRRGRVSRSLFFPLTVWQEEMLLRRVIVRFAVAVRVGDLDLARLQIDMRSTLVNQS